MIFCNILAIFSQFCVVGSIWKRGSTNPLKLMCSCFLHWMSAMVLAWSKLPCLWQEGLAIPTSIIPPIVEVATYSNWWCGYSKLHYKRCGYSKLHYRRCGYSKLHCSPFPCYDMRYYPTSLSPSPSSPLPCPCIFCCCDDDIELFPPSSMILNYCVVLWEQKRKKFKKKTKVKK